MLTDRDAAEDPPVRQLEREDRGARAGLTEAGTTWPDLVGHWGDNWHVLAPDLRGHGQSPRFTEDEVAPAPEVLLADVITVVDAQPAACDTNARCARL